MNSSECPEFKICDIDVSTLIHIRYLTVSAGASKLQEMQSGKMAHKLGEARR